MKIFNLPTSSTPCTYPFPPPPPDIKFNKTETTFDCPWFHTCTTFESLADCLTEKQRSNSAMECIKTTIHRTVEYVKKCVIGIQEECNTQYSDNSHRRCVSNGIRCISHPITLCEEKKTGTFIDGPITVQGIKESGVFTDEPLSYVQILGIAVVACVILGGIISLKEQIEFSAEQPKTPSKKIKYEKIT